MMAYESLLLMRRIKNWYACFRFVAWGKVPSSGDK